MKTLTVVLAVLFFAVVGWTDYGFMEEEVEVVEEEVAEEAASPPFVCPGSQISSNEKCMDCHILGVKDDKPAFILREVLLEANYLQKPFGLSIYEEDGKPVAKYVLTNIVPTTIDEISKYLTAHPEIKKFIMEIHSPGGSVMDAWRIVGLLDGIKKQGVHVQTQCNGIAASAGAILLVAGDTRLVSPTAEIMIHKVWTFSMFAIADPDSANDKADMLKHFQKNINEYIAGRTKITVDELNTNTFHRMWWLTGEKAVELGVGTGFIGE